jgi:hypothetical protein
MRAVLFTLLAIAALGALGWVVKASLEGESTEPLPEEGVARSGDTVEGPRILEPGSLKPRDRPGPVLPDLGPGPWEGVILTFPAGTKQVTGEVLLQAVSQRFQVRAPRGGELATLKDMVLMTSVPETLHMGEAAALLRVRGYESQVRDGKFMLWRPDSAPPRDGATPR